MSEYAAPEDSFPKLTGSGSGGILGYTVEARLAYPEAGSILGQIFDLRWKRVHFDPGSPVGVPGPRSQDAARLGLMDYAQAQAMRWWFVAAADAEFSAGCVETRIVKHTGSYTYTAQAVSAHAYIGGDDRSYLMPDWGKKPEAEGVNNEADKS